MDNRYKKCSENELKFMLLETKEAFNALTTAIYNGKYSHDEMDILLKAERILDFRHDRILAALNDIGFKKADIDEVNKND